MKTKEKQAMPNIEIYEHARRLCPHHIRRHVIKLAHEKYRCECPLMAVLCAMEEYGFEVRIDE